MYSKPHSKRTLLIGSGRLLESLLSESCLLSSKDYDVVGRVISDNHCSPLKTAVPVVGTLDDLQKLVKTYKPELFIVGKSQERTGRQRRGNDRTGRFNHFLVEAKLLHGVEIETAAITYERLTGKLPIEAYAPEDILRSTVGQCRGMSDVVSRTLSATIAFFALLLVLPVLLVIALVVSLDSPGPIFFVQERLGINSTRFKLFKFRTMSVTTATHSEWAADNAHRVTKSGAILRRYRLDELPQLLNVLLGDMNLVGPRPHPASNFKLFALTSRNTPDSGSEIPFYFLRCSVRPGITGWAQVKYCYANNLDEEIEKLRYDLYYIKYRSLWMDARILLETVGIILSGREGADPEPAQSTSTKHQTRPVIERRAPPIEKVDTSSQVAS